MTETATATTGASQAAVNAEVTHRLVHAFGAITSVLMKSPPYRHHYIADLEWLVAPAVASAQYSLAEAQMKETGMAMTVACALWAMVSEDVDRRLLTEARYPIRLRPAEWTSGHIPWLIEAVGEPSAVARLLDALIRARFSATGLRAMRPGPDGRWSVQVLQVTPQPAPQPGADQSNLVGRTGLFLHGAYKPLACGLSVCL